MLPIPDIPIPDLPSLLPFPLPGLEEPLFTAFIVVAGVFSAVDATVMWRMLAGREQSRLEVDVAMVSGYGMSFAYGYATATWWMWLPALGMYVFEAVRIRLGLSRREVLTEIVLWLRRRFGDLEPRN